MELNWLQSLIMGLCSGLTDILPVSSQAHQALLLTFFGGTSLEPMTRLMIRLASLLTLFLLCRGQMERIRRQLRLVRLPKRSRTRTPDMAPIMDARIIQTALWPMAIGLALYGLFPGLRSSLAWLALGSLLNAVLLYLPRLFRTADKDSRLVTPFESIQMGMGAGAAVMPGVSSVGVSYSVGILHGMDHGYMVHLSMMMHLVFNLGLTVYDLVAVIGGEPVVFQGADMLSWGLAAGMAALGTVLGYRWLNTIARRSGLTGFSFYSFGMALFTFVLYLMV